MLQETAQRESLRMRHKGFIGYSLLSSFRWGVPDGYHRKYSDDAGDQKHQAWEPVERALIDLGEGGNVGDASHFKGHLQQCESHT